MSDIEAGFLSQVPLEQRRALGQFFTPPAVARLMAGWCLSAGARSLLDPAVGTGLLIREALRRNPALQVTGCDRDPAVLAACAAAIRLPVRLHCLDFLLDFPAVQFDAIISNPPYLGYKNLPYDQSIFARYDELCAIRLNRQSNLYVLFILAITRHLAPGGRAAVLVPSDWLNGNFGAPLKAYLLREQLLDGLIVFDQRDLLFTDSLATACLLLLRRGRDADEPVHFSAVGQADDLGLLDEERLLPRSARSTAYAPARLSPEQKWLPLLPLELAALEPAPGSGEGYVRLGELAEVRRGIATGANDYFMLSAAAAERHGLEPALLKRCLARAAQAPGADVTCEDVERLLRSNADLLLLDPPPGPPGPALERYLQQGLAQGIDRRYLPSHRRPWYRMEQRRPAPILCTTFARGAVRFILNRALIYNLTAFHGVTLRPPLRREDWLYERALLSFLVTPLATAGLRSEQRLYGGGLRKLEPADVTRVPVPDLRGLPETELQALAALFDRLCQEQRAGLQGASLPLLQRRWEGLLGREAGLR